MLNNEQLREQSMDTRCVQAGFIPGNGDPRVMPIIQSTTYAFDTAEELGEVFDLKVAKHMYSRLGNPTLQWLEEKIAVMEGGVGACMTSSGQAANLFSILNITRAGQHVLAMNNLYGGTHTLLGSQCKRLGIDITFVDPHLPLDELKNEIRDHTRAIFAETLGNPALDVLDFEKISALAAYADVPLIVDNTFPTPYLCNPIAHGAHIVTHSTTKYLDGHATSVGGCLVDGGTFNWDNGKYPELTEPDKDYHGVVYNEAFGKLGYIIKAHAGLLRDLGSTMSPFNAFLTNIGIETLHLRMQRHSENALKVASFLENHPDVAWVRYPGLKNDPNYELAQKYLPRGQSGVIAFGPKGGAERARKVIDALELASLVTHVGDARTHVIHPASTTHRQLDEAALRAGGVAPELIRYSIGIEDADDIIRDMDQALTHTR